MADTNQSATSRTTLHPRTSGVDAVGLPVWVEWIVGSAPRLAMMVVCGNGASVAASELLKRGGVEKVHVVETDRVLAAGLFLEAGDVPAVNAHSATYWRSPSRFSEWWSDSDRESASYGLLILPGVEGSLDRIFSELAGCIAWLGMAIDFESSSASSKRVVVPNRLYSHLSGLEPTAHERFDSLDCMTFVARERDTNELSGGYLVARVLLSASEAATKRQLAEKDLELRRLRSELKSARRRGERDRRQLEQLAGSVAYTMSRSIADALYSPRRLLRLPAELVDQGRQFLRQRRARAGIEAARAKETSVADRGAALAPAPTFDEERKSLLKAQVAGSISHGSDAVELIALEFAGSDSTPSVKALALLVAAQACSANGRHDMEFELAQRALTAHRSVGILRGYLHAALRSRRMEEADAALREMIGLSRKGVTAAKEFIARFEASSTYKLAALAEIPERRTQWAWPRPKRIGYVLHNSLPFSSGGYATRSHGVATGLIATGADVVCLTRPGYPLDIKPELAGSELPQHDVVDGVDYVRLPKPSRTGFSEYEYMMRSVPRVEAALRKAGVGYVQAASNYVTGLPALIAARRLGLPFFYEVRGLWEITRMSREPEFETSAAFAVQRHIESVVAREADHVFTLTEPMREELILRGVEPQRITLLPNSVDADKFLPMSRDDVLAQRLSIPPDVPVIGYIGTFVAYEGLEDLVSACVELHRVGQDFRLMLIGNENASGQGRGPISEEIIRIATDGGILDKVIMPGRVPHEEVASYYSLVDISPFPRKPWPVCEMVSPMKPLEALAMEKAVLVSSVRALTEMIEDGVTGRVFEKGSVESLFQVMREMIAEPQSRAMLGRAGRRWVQRDRSWRQVAAEIQREMAAADSAGGMSISAISVDAV